MEYLVIKTKNKILYVKITNMKNRFKKGENNEKTKNINYTLFVRTFSISNVYKQSICRK